MRSAVAAQKPVLGVSNHKCAILTPRAPTFSSTPRLALPHSRHTPRRSPTTAQAAQNKDKSTDKADATTRKFGLEAGLWEVFRSQNNLEGKTKGEQAKELLTKYGSAYLITSISFAVVSFAACYALVASGVDVGAVLSKFGLQVTDTSEKVGTFAIAYAAHKALSPVRFPPTVALTPAVAKWLGKDIPQGSGNGSKDD